MRVTRNLFGAGLPTLPAVPFEGCVFWYQAGDETPHLWLVLNEPTATVDAIIVNFTGAENIESPPFIIKTGHLLVVPPYHTSKPTTLNVSEAFTLSKACLESSGLPTPSIGKLNYKLLPKCRNAMYSTRFVSLDVANVLAHYRGQWFSDGQ
jgi:hypothetical protein